MSNSVRPHRWQPTRLLSLGFSRQEYWSGLPFASPACESEVAQSCLTLHDPMDCSPPGSSVHGFLRQEYWSGLPLPSSYKLFMYCKISDVLRATTSSVLKEFIQLPKNSLQFEYLQFILLVLCFFIDIYFQLGSHVF